MDPEGTAFSYSPMLHPALASGPAELLLTFMSNGDAPTVAADTRLYVPQAVRLTIATADGDGSRRRLKSDDEAPERWALLGVPTFDALVGDEAAVVGALMISVGLAIGSCVVEDRSSQAPLRPLLLRRVVQWFARCFLVARRFGPGAWSAAASLVVPSAPALTPQL